MRRVESVQYMALEREKWEQRFVESVAGMMKEIILRLATSKTVVISNTYLIRLFSVYPLKRHY